MSFYLYEGQWEANYVVLDQLFEGSFGTRHVLEGCCGSWGGINTKGDGVEIDARETIS